MLPLTLSKQIRSRQSRDEELAKLSLICPLMQFAMRVLLAQKSRKKGILLLHVRILFVGYFDASWRCFFAALH